MSDSNVVIANFINTKEIKTAPIFQYDYGMMLQFNNVSLPASYEVHFANYRFGASKVMIGDSTGVEIPYEYTKNYGRVFAWVFIHESEGVGWTKYLAEIPVIQRAKPSYDPVDPKEQSIVEQLASTVEGLQDDVEGLQDDVEEVQEDVQTLQKKKADVIVSSASGAVATFSDGADDMPVESLKCYIEPVQDLNGYDNPWPAGGGKNLYNANAINALSSNGITATVDNGVITFNGTATANAYFSVNQTGLVSGQYAFSFNNPVASNNVHVSFRTMDGAYFLDIAASEVNKSVVINGEPNRIILYVKSGTTLTNFVVKPQLESGSTATTFAPYSNICPISGHTGANIKKTGKNILQSSTAYGASSGVTFRGNNNYTVAIDGTSTETYPQIVLYGTPKKLIPVGTTVTLSHKVHNAPVGSAVYLYVYERDSSTSFTNLASYRSTESGVTFTVQYPYQLIIVVAQGNGLTYTDCTIEYQIEVGSTATSIDTESSFSNIDVSWETEAGTVYGGTLDVTTGVLTVDRAFAQLNDPDKWSSFVGTVDFRYDNRFTNRKMHSDSYTGLLCSYIGVVPGGGETARWIGADGAFFGIKSSALTIEQVKSDAAAGKISICYPLATPTTYTITPQELTTLLGNNSIYCDTGNVEVSYPADTKLYIDGKIAELQALVLEN